MQPPAMLAALKSGAIDGGVHTFPWTKTSQRQGDVLFASGITDMPELLPFASTTTATRPDLCDKKPSICAKLVEGYVQAHVFIQDHPQETLAILAKRMPSIHADDLAGSFVLMQKTIPRSPRFTEEGLAHAQELMLLGGMIKPDEKVADFSAMYTNKFIK
jgi:ABC-type nitrate/sulfonate/bicarbonate transport system substrate-binding protein